MGANSGDRIFSLLSEPPSDAASAQGLGRFSTRRAPWRVQATLAMNRQETAIGNGSRWLDGLGGPGRAVPRIIARSRDGNFPLPNTWGKTPPVRRGKSTCVRGLGRPCEDTPRISVAYRRLSLSRRRPIMSTARVSPVAQAILPEGSSNFLCRTRREADPQENLPVLRRQG